jgi:hypothetical protein
MTYQLFAGQVPDEQVPPAHAGALVSVDAGAGFSASAAFFRSAEG